MKAMIFAAGMGTRLQPLTNDRPKALVEVNGIPLLELVIKRVIKYGFTDLVVNVHHYADMVENFLSKKNNFNVSITISNEREYLLETGGGLKKAVSFFNDNKPFLIHNVDILSDTDLSVLYNVHLKNKSLATLSCKNRVTSRSFLINNINEICGWRNNTTGELKLSKGKVEELNPIAFNGIHIIDPAIFPLITETGAFSLTDVYLRLAKDHSIKIFKEEEKSFWMDMGKKENVWEAEKMGIGKEL